MLLHLKCPNGSKIIIKLIKVNKCHHSAAWHENTVVTIFDFEFLKSSISDPRSLDH